MGVTRKHKYSILAASAATGTLGVAGRRKCAFVAPAFSARTLVVPKEPRWCNMATSTFAGTLGFAREPKSTNVAANEGTTSDPSMHATRCTSSNDTSIHVVSLNTELFVFVASVNDVP
jgi:hypothetical protein